MSSCSSDYLVYEFSKNLKYNYFDDYINVDLKGKNKYKNLTYQKNNKYIANLVDGIIPIGYTYSKAYDLYQNKLRTIPLPINSNNVEFFPQVFHEGKIIVFHGITRVGFKGTKFITEAMKKLKINYPEIVEIVISNKTSLKNYLLNLEKANIVVDQALSYEYGMNALYSMASGKVVLSGNEEECQVELNRNDIPVINIKPSIEDIYIKLEQLILNKEKIIKLGKESRLFVENFHNHKKVANEYLKLWNSIKVKND
jgi:hypothetical protein